MTQQQNRVNALEVSSVPGIAEALDIHWSSRDYAGKPISSPTKTFNLQTHGALQLTLADGAVLVIGTSEWCDVDYYAPPAIAEIEKDSERLAWVERRLFDKSWNGVIDGGSRTHWRIAGDIRHTTQKMVGHTFRDAVDAGMAALPLSD